MTVNISHKFIHKNFIIKYGVHGYLGDFSCTSFVIGVIIHAIHQNVLWLDFLSFRGCFMFHDTSPARRPRGCEGETGEDIETQK